MDFRTTIWIKTDGTSYEVLDLFEDESIDVSSSIQDIQDISKVFTDFTQSFSVPATNKNNAIFSYFYNNDLDVFDANTRVPAKIEINLSPFRKGKIQLEEAIVEKNQVQSYKVTFYGDVVTLKDLFGADKLKDLDYTSLNVTHDGPTVENTITSTSNLDVRFPLISSERVWTYGDATSEDVNTTGGAIVWDELFPAVKDKKILDLIASKYSLTFSGNFLTNKRFTNSFTYWKNRETTNFISEPLPLEFNTLALSCNSDLPSNIVGDSEINVQYIDMATFTQPASFTSWAPSQFHRIVVYVYNTTTSNTWYLDVYKNGSLFQTHQHSGDTLVTVLGQYDQFNTYGLNDKYTFKMRASGSLTFDFDIKYTFNTPYYDGSNVITQLNYDCQHTTASNTISTVLDFSSSAPDMTISEWFSGTLKQFNLTCYPLSSDLTFQIEPLEDWYANGNKVDITPYVDTDKISYARPKLFQEITFEWKESKSFINEAFKEFNNREYGNLTEVFPDFDGGKYDVSLPFETLLFSNIDTDNSNLQLGYCLTKSPDYKPYIPNPIKLYLQDATTPVDFYFNDGTTNNNITSYLPFGQEVVHNTETFTINFGQEISTLDNLPKSRSLYDTYYKPYLLNLYDTKTRIVTLKCILPIGMITKLTLDDAILIRDKKYRINSMKTNMNTGVVDLVLISDWIAERGKLVIGLVPAGGGTIVIPVKPPKGGWIDIAAPIETPFVTSSPTLPATNEGEQNWEITVPVNSTGGIRTNTIVYTGYNPDGSVEYQRTITITQEDSDSFLLAEDGGYLLTESLDKIKI